MSTKNNNNKDHYTSPYATGVHQYPSQSSDFLSLDIDSRQSKNPRRDRNSSTGMKRFQENDNAESIEGGGGTRGGGGGGGYGNVPYFYRNPANQYYDGMNHGTNNTRNNRGRYFNEGHNRRGFGYGENQNRGYFQRQNYNRRGNSGPPRSGYSPRSYQMQKTSDQVGMFFHPSMLEDPWEDLVNRRNKLKQRYIESCKSEESANAKDENDEDNNEKTNESPSDTQDNSEDSKSHDEKDTT